MLLLREIKNKIGITQNIYHITRALELVSAVKMKKSQQEAVEGRPYHDSLEMVILPTAMFLRRLVLQTLKPYKEEEVIPLR